MSRQNAPSRHRRKSIHPQHDAFAHELTPLQRAIMETPHYSNRPSVRALLEEEEEKDRQ